MLAWRLPELPPALREALGYEGFHTPPAMILPPELARTQARGGEQAGLA